MTTQTEKLASQPIGKLFTHMALPIIFGLMVNGLYNVVDAIFVTRGVGPLAIGGVSIVFPLQMLLYATSSLIGTGSASIISRLLGAKDIKGAESVAGNAISIGIIASLAFAGLMLLFLEPVLRMIGVTEQLLPYAYDYALPLVMCSTIMMLTTVFSELLRAEGKMYIMSMMLLLSSVLNIVLDAVFIFGLDMGVTGAAVATVISQAIGLCLALYIYFNKRTAVAIRRKNLAIKSNNLKQILALGVPTFIGNGGVAITIGLANFSLRQYGGLDTDMLISAYGITTRITIFIILPLIGMMIAFQTICGFNYGAQNMQRVLEVLKVALIVTTVYAGFCAAVMVFMPETIVSLFTSDVVLIGNAVSISQLIFIGFVTAGMGFISGALFQAIGKAKSAMFLSTARVFLFLVPMLIWLPMNYGLKGIWIAFPIADGIAFLIALVFLMIERKRLVEYPEMPSKLATQ